MNYHRHTAPATEPLSLTEVQAHLRISTDDPAITTINTEITRLIQAAREYVENNTNYLCITQKWYAYLNSWKSGDRIYILKYPVTEISKIEYYATDDATELTELPTSSYDVAVNNYPPEIYLKEKPSTGNKLNAIRISFTGGSAAADVNMTVKQAMLFMIGHWYENRQDEVSGRTISKFDKGSDFLLEKIKMITP